MKTNIPQQLSAMFISHGGGPLPVLDDPAHRELVDHLNSIASIMRKPSAIVVISAHWEAPVVTVTTNPNPPLIYDYFGFPPESYSIKYPAVGNPALARDLIRKLNEAGIEARADDERGFDHGLFIPLKLMYPDADIPCVQVSLHASLDPATHIQIGQALFWLAKENILVLGSGFSFHNLKVLLGAQATGPDIDNEAFEDWLINTCAAQSLDESEREGLLVNWSRAPGARYCHPREEHLLPLHVCYGVTRQACLNYQELTIMDKKCSTYFW
jgi:aromatic ring-opening dioxygenase catalytic subunit (LigB family)